MTSADLKRFWGSVNKDGPGGCWLWMGRRQKGYGYLWAESKQHRVTRLMWTLKNGPIPDGLNVLHKCDNPPCCNPDHLFLGTPKTNAEDRDIKGRGVVPYGSQCHTAILNEEKVAHILLISSQGLSNREIALLYGVQTKLIRRVVKRESWKHVPMPLKEAA